MNSPPVLASVAAYLATYAAMVALPGPGLASLIANVLSRGSKGTWGYIAGFLLGDLIWFAVAVVGLSASVALFSPILQVVRIGGALYLAYLGVRLIISHAAFERGESEGSTGNWASFVTSLSICLGNPKVILFFLALLPTVVDIPHLTPRLGLTLGAGMAVIMVLVMLGYTVVAQRARRFFQSPTRLRGLNIVTGCILVAVAGMIALRH